MFRYSSVVGMIFYLSGHNPPDIAFAVNLCARCMFCLKRTHELELNKFVRYLNHNQEHGLVLDPNSDIFKVDVYPDADSAEIYGHKNPDDPVCTKSCTGFIIMFYGCPVLCIYKI